MVDTTDPLVRLSPDSELTARTVRLVHGAIKKDFRDQFEAESALFEFVLAREQSVQQARYKSDECIRLLEAVRSRIVASLPKTIGVDSLAAEYGMSRSNFSHFFRARTGLSPAHSATEARVHEAARMLHDRQMSLRQIALACGFVNASHFCRVFRLYQQLTPAAYREAIGLSEERSRLFR
jgi:two-component system response regulator YesN